LLLPADGLPGVIISRIDARVGLEVDRSVVVPGLACVTSLFHVAAIGRGRITAICLIVSAA
jgi:hypothetical protein